MTSYEKMARQRIDKYVMKYIDNKSNDIVLVSGAGAGGGESKKYTGKRTIRAIRAKITRETDHGDRWAYALVFAHLNQRGEGVWINVLSGEYAFLDRN
jgi:hypothetical protein